MNRHANNLHIVRRIASRVADGEREFGNIHVKEDGNYLLFNYSKAAMYNPKGLTRTEEACRGLVIRKDGKISALPMPKFYNLGQRYCPHLPKEPYTVWEKIDGSLAIFWYDALRDEWRVNTRGSFDNIYTQRAIQMWNRNYLNQGWRNHWTVMCEICIDGDENPRAAYKPEGLYLLAIRDNYSGTNLDISSLPITMPMAARLDATIDEIQALAKEQEGHEGWVVLFDSGVRVKIKTAWYLRIFRAMQSLTPANVRELMIEAGEDWLSEFPDDLQPEAAEIQREIEERYSSLLNRIFKAYAQIAKLETRKEFAIAVMKDYPDISSWLFNLRDDRFDELEVLRKMEV